MRPLSLQNIQKIFTDTIFDRSEGQILSFVNGESDYAKDKRLDIYRNNIFYSLTDALSDLYPVIKRLVGEQFFNATAIEFIRKRPPRRAAMIYFAEDFPEFLREFEHTHDMTYLADVARVELAWHQAYHAADATPLWAEDLSVIPAEQLMQSRFILHPSVHLLNSPYPVLKIWNANQDEGKSDEVIDLDSGAVNICVSRLSYEVRLRELNQPAYRLLLALQSGASLEIAMIQAAEVDPAKSTEEVLALSICEGLFVNIIEG